MSLTHADWIDLFEERMAVMAESGVPEPLLQPKARRDIEARFGPCPQPT